MLASSAIARPRSSGPLGEGLGQSSQVWCITCRWILSPVTGHRHSGIAAEETEQRHGNQHNRSSPYQVHARRLDLGHCLCRCCGARRRRCGGLQDRRVGVLFTRRIELALGSPPSRPRLPLPLVAPPVWVCRSYPFRPAVASLDAAVESRLHPKRSRLEAGREEVGTLTWVSVPSGVGGHLDQIGSADYKARDFCAIVASERDADPTRHLVA